MKPTENSSLSGKDERRFEYSDIVLVSSFFLSIFFFLTLILLPIYFRVFSLTEEQERLETLEKLELEFCGMNACHNGGNCSANIELNFTCSCLPEWRGRRCEIAREAEIEVNTTIGVRLNKVWMDGEVAAENLIRSYHYYFNLQEDAKCLAFHLTRNSTVEEVGFSARIKYDSSKLDNFWRCSNEIFQDWEKCSTDLSGWKFATWQNTGQWIKGEKELWCRSQIKK